MTTNTDPIHLLRGSVTSSLAQIVELKNTLKAREASIRDLEAAKGQLTLDLQSERATVSRLNARIGQLEASIKESEGSRKELESRLQKAEAEVSALISENQKLAKVSKKGPK